MDGNGRGLIQIHSLMVMSFRGITANYEIKASHDEGVIAFMESYGTF